MARNDRLFRLLQILRDGKLHRAVDLARDLGVSERTIWRDMATLTERGLPVHGERGVGYVLRDPITLPPLALSRDEMEVLRLGLALVAAGADPVLSRAAASLRARISAVAPLDASETGADTFVFSSPEAARAAPHLGLIRRALREHLTLILNFGGGDPIRIRPLHLEFWGKAWTLLAWSEYHNDFRVFRVDLVNSIKHDGGAFLPEPGKSVEDYLARIVTRP